MHLTPALSEHAAALLSFEQENRQHFEQWISSRGEQFYQLSEVAKSLEQMQWLAKAGQEYHFLAWLDQEIVGRVALRGVEREQYHKASLGYRFSARHGGRGYASQAVSQVVNEAFQALSLHRIEAVVIPQNLGSLAVMRKCGFQQFGHSRSAVLRHRQWMDLLYFERHAPDLEAAGQPRY